MATWIRALVSGKVFNADYQQQWLESVQAEDPENPDGQKYGYGISYQRFSPTAAMYYHGGEMPGFNSFMGYDPDNDVSLVIWTNLTISPRRQDDSAGSLADDAGRDLHRTVARAGAYADADQHEVTRTNHEEPHRSLLSSATDNIEYYRETRLYHRASDRCGLLA